MFLNLVKGYTMADMTLSDIAALNHDNDWGGGCW